jgi:hypothetical protein
MQFSRIRPACLWIWPGLSRLGLRCRTRFRRTPSFYIPSAAITDMATIERVAIPEFLPTIHLHAVVVTVHCTRKLSDD